MPYSSGYSSGYSHTVWPNIGTYSRHTFSSNYLLLTQSASVYTSDPSYLQLFKCKVEIYNNSKTTLLHTYTMFDEPNQTSILMDVDITNSSVNKTFTLRFANDEDLLDETVIGLGNYIKIYGGKTSDNLFFLTSGYIVDRNPVILGDDIKDYILIGEGDKSQTNRLISTFRRASTSLDENNDNNNVIRLPDSKMTIKNILNELLTKKDARITKDFTFQDYLGLDISGIDQNLDERILSISERLKELSEIINFIATVTNAFWDIEDGRLTFEHPQLHHSGIIIKNKQIATDLADSIAYFIGVWDHNDTIRKSEGHANALYNLSSADQKSVASQNLSSKSTALYGTGAAQRFSAIDTRFSNLILIMSKIGTVFPTDTPIEKQIVKGEIRIDSNGKPNGPLIATFEVPVSSITENKDNVFINDLNISSDVLSPNTYYWIIFLPVGESLNSTIRWHHDGIINPADHTKFSAIASVPVNNTNTINGGTANWIVSEIGPTYAFNVFSKIRQTQYYKDSDSADLYGLTEDLVEFPEIDDPLSIARLMQTLLALRSRPIRKYKLNEVTIPNNKIFKPGQVVTIVDNTARHEESKNVFAIIQEVRYHWSADADESGIGLFKCDILPIGFLDFKIEELYNIN